MFRSPLSDGGRLGGRSTPKKRSVDGRRGGQELRVARDHVRHAIGQFIAGILGDRVGTRKIVLVGMFGSDGRLVDPDMVYHHSPDCPGLGGVGAGQTVAVSLDALGSNGQFCPYCPKKEDQENDEP